MRRIRYASFLLVLFMAIASFGRNLPNIDKLGEHAASTGNAAALAQKAAAFTKKGMPLSGEPRFGVPTFVWASQLRNVDPTSFKAGTTATPGEAEGAARQYLGLVASLYNLGDADIADAPLRFIHDLGQGPIIVKLQQKIDGIEIFREEINVVMNQKLELVAISGYISSRSTPAASGSLSFSLGESNAASRALNDVTFGSINSSQLIPTGSHDGYDFFTLPVGSSTTLVEPVRMKKVYFHTPDGLTPGYYVEVLARSASDSNDARIDAGADSDGYSYVISAVDGSILFRMNMQADAQGGGGQASLGPGGFTYKVWADTGDGIPYDTPAGNSVHPKIIATPDGQQYPFVAAQNVQLPNYPFSQNDPWLPAGSTTTSGNNVEAFVNLVNAAGNVDNGFGPAAEPPADPPLGDHHAFTTAVDQFIHSTVPDVDAYSADARQGAITQLFYNINFLHDWYYDSGFNEVSGNAQTNNFGRGGVQNDNIKGQAQDTSSFSNANMLTPADGGRPRMRMYNFPNVANMLDVQAPAGIVSKMNIGISQTGKHDFDISSDIVIATFSNAPTACTITNAAALAGKIAMFDFDNTDGTGCSFSTRITRIHATSASVALMVYTSASPTAVANITGIVSTHTKGVGVISWNNGQLIKGVIGGNTVTARLLRVADRDGSLDQQIVFHEWGHYLSNRLISNSAGLNTNYSGGMGEGWGDFSAMMLTVREADTGTASNSNWDGAYALATYATSGVPFNGSANQGYYFGIRRYPYSTDIVNKNPLTFKHIANGTPLPVSPAPAFGQTGTSNSEVHNTGEVWTTMMWECYAALLRDTLGATPRLDFTTAQKRMKMYLVASLKMTPPSPTMLETRDAVLAAAAATDLIDYHEFAVAFAKRGAGLGAISPDRFSGTNSPVTESFVSGGELTFVGATLDDSTSSCDHDGVLDNNESGKLTVTLHNAGDITLTSTTATVTSPDPNITIANGGVINFPTSLATENPVGTVDVTFTGAAGIDSVQLNVSFNDPALALAGPRNATTYASANTNAIPASTATDTFESLPSLWTLYQNNALSNFYPFVRKQDPASTNHFWFGPDGNIGSDQGIVSPVFTVNGSGSVNVQFDHSFSFEFDGGGNYDGGVVEYSVNGGAFADFGTAGGLPNYNGIMLVYSGNVNPLQGRSGFVQSSGGTIHTSFTKAIAPGSTVQIRFRAASDSSVGIVGWTIDNVAFTGVVETPFTTIVADPGCTSPTSTTLTPSANPSAAGASLTLTATVLSTRPVTGGTVTFYDGASPLATNPVTSGVATYVTSSLTVGPHPLSATYNPIPGFGGSTSSVLNETIAKANTTTVVTSSVNPVALLTPVTYFVTVTASSGVTPTGSVAIYDNAVFKSNSALNGSGVGTWSTVYTAGNGGAHTISATYNGSTTMNGSNGSMIEYVDPSSFSFSPSTYYQLENAGPVTLTIVRTGGNTSNAASVNFTTNDGSAVQGVRYTTTTTTVNFAGGETSKTVNVPLINNSSIEGVQSFTATISLPVGAILGAPTTATVNVLDDDIVNSDFSSPSDGKRDIAWRNATTGDTRVWQMNNTTFISSTLLENLGSPWVLVGIGDFNADGKADILWRNSTDQSMQVWYMNGTVHSGTASMPSSPDPNWRVVAVGDLNGDGYCDIVWRHATTFASNVWLMRDTALLATTALPTVPDGNWQIIGLGDFNRDHKQDIVWRNSASLDVAVWLMNFTTFTSAAFLPKVGYPWQLVGIGDMNGDGDADMIWQTSTTHQIALWQMNQTALGSAFFISTAGDPTTANDPNYAIVGPK